MDESFTAASRRRVVVVDDEAPRVWAHAGRRLGIDVILVDRALDTLGTVLRTRPDAVILDLRLPDGDGRDLLAELKRGPETAPIPVVVLSGSLAAFEAETCLELGASFVAEKPVSFERIVARALGPVACQSAA